MRSIERTRNGYGPRSRGRGGSWRGHQRRTNAAQTSSPGIQVASPPYGQLLKTVTDESLRDDPRHRAGSAKISECQYVASFNWLKNTHPTIVVPGEPPQWAPLTEPRQLDQDASEYFRDINAVHFPQHSMEPAVRAAIVQSPALARTEVDVFACGSTMGNLLRFAQKSDKPFRFVVEAVGETVFFIRRENKPDEKMVNVKGYGHTFPAAYTRLASSVANSDSHQRLIRYDFSGFNCIVRCEVDGYLPDLAPSTPLPGKMSAIPDLGGLHMISDGQIIPQEAILDVKTRAAWRKLSLEDVLHDEIARLWLRQIPTLVLAHHNRGVFDDVVVHDIRDRIASFERQQEDAITLLSYALATVVAYARAHADERFEVCSQSPGVLEIRRVGGSFPSALPDDLKGLWLGDADGESEFGGEEEEEEEEEEEDGVYSDTESEAGAESDGDSDRDFTACSADCAYCGRCRY